VRRFSIIGLSLILTLASFGAGLARADEETTTDVTIRTTEAGEFTIALRSANPDDPPTFGNVALDADSDQHLTKDLVLDYVDTFTQRGPGDVSLTISSFEPASPVPTFEGSDQVHFQIPNRYVTVSDVGEALPDAPPNPCDGAINPVVSDLNSSYEAGGPFRVAHVDAGCGVGRASQSISLALTVPAGVYPTTYSATITIETTVDSVTP
jgi:hypothetical protein